MKSKLEIKGIRALQTLSFQVLHIVQPFDKLCEESEDLFLMLW